MTQAQLDAMKAAARATGKPAGSHPQLQPGTQLVRRRDNHRITIDSIHNDEVTLVTSKGYKFTSTIGSDLLAEFEVVR